MNLARTVLPGSLLVKGLSFLPLYHPCSLPQPMESSSAVLPLPGTRISGQILCQLPWAANHPDMWVHSHHLGGKGWDPCSSKNTHNQLPGHLPWVSLQKEDTALLLFLVFCALFFFHWCFMLSYRRISPEKLPCIRLSVFIYDLKGKHLLPLLSCHLSSAFLVAVVLLVVSSFFLYPHYLSALYLPVSVIGHMLVSVFSGTKSNSLFLRGV